MADYYAVKQGDHLSKIAAAHGFRDHLVIWNHPNNAELKQERKNPSVLYPGDRVFIPDAARKEVSGATEKRHRFVAKRERLMLRLVLEDQLERPIAKAKCRLIVDGGAAAELTSDDKGKIEREIPREAKTATLVIASPETPFDGEIFQISIGALDPVETATGQLARLNNLGYFAGAAADSDAASFRSAAEEFQCDHGLTVDGKVGPQTQAKLKETHGG